MSDPEANPWQTLSTRPVYENPWIRIREDQVRRPDGEPGIYGVVEFRHLAVGIVPVDAEGYTWLVGQYRYTMDEYTWEIPAGGCPEGETPDDTASRELLEEAGLKADRWSCLGPVQLSNSCTAERGLLFLAEGVSEHGAQPEATERLQVRRVPLAEAVAMAYDGRITDGMSIIGLWKAQRAIVLRGP